MTERLKSDTPQAKLRGRFEMKQDDIVRKLVPDPAQPAPDTRVLNGFLGQAARSGYWRLYLSPQLGEYVEFSEEAVIDSASLRGERSRPTGTVVWLKQNAVVQHIQATTHQVQAEFLRGGVPTAFYAGTSGGMRPQARIATGLQFSSQETRDTFFTTTRCLPCITSPLIPCNTEPPGVCTLATDCRSRFPPDCPLS
jgi:hypothetical protein